MKWCWLGRCGGLGASWLKKIGWNYLHNLEVKIGEEHTWFRDSVGLWCLWCLLIVTRERKHVCKGVMEFLGKIWQAQKGVSYNWRGLIEFWPAAWDWGDAIFVVIAFEREDASLRGVRGVEESEDIAESSLASAVRYSCKSCWEASSILTSSSKSWVCLLMCCWQDSSLKSKGSLLDETYSMALRTG